MINTNPKIMKANETLPLNFCSFETRIIFLGDNMIGESGFTEIRSLSETEIIEIFWQNSGYDLDDEDFLNFAQTKESAENWVIFKVYDLEKGNELFK
jgi:hypothetical protein